MGLAASQARLLTITARKSDCEYESMRLSHQKIALSREMTEISNEYQNSLNKTNLYYDFYGTGDTSNPLTYSLLMTPSALNDYLPTLITNNQGRVVLDSGFAAAARAAGIPQEGLGSLPSDELRNKFVEGLFNNGIISNKTKEAIQGASYNQDAGLGSTDLKTVISEDYTLAELRELLKYSGDAFCLYTPQATNASDERVRTHLYINGSEQAGSSYTELSVYDLLSGSNDTYLRVNTNKRGMWPTSDGDEVALDDANMFLESLIEEFGDYFNGLLDTSDGITANAISYATRMTKETFIHDQTSEYATRVGTNGKDKDIAGQDDVMGWAIDNQHSTWFRESRANFSMNLSNLLEGYLTYFAEYMDGIANAGKDYDIDLPNYKDKSSLIGDDFVFRVVTGESISADDAKMALFYDTLFNQLCTKGWTENDEVNDKEYLQEMFKNGMMYISTCDDDGYYYQGNYSTNTYVKEISDESWTSAAEAKYQNEKSRLTAKEDELDLKMKNLDTEISALTTEYDSVKSVITKNIEKSFKRYNA